MATSFKHPKSGIYYVRVVVPKNLREVIRKHEFKWSLRTKDLKTAKLRALPLAEKAYSQIESAIRKLSCEADVELSFKDCVIVAERWCARMRDEVETQGNMLDSVSHDAFSIKD